MHARILAALPLLFTTPVSCQGQERQAEERHGEKRQGQDKERPVNRLADETSPYLLQHKHNPVDWYPWGPEALAKAKRENKVIFLSIGYSACHWCHVMEHQSFENPEIAKLMNEYFVNVKVDREERPDLDEIYMAAVQAMTGSGGWPMSVFMTPDLKPFFGGTYFPPEDQHGRPGFKRVLKHVHDLWTKSPDKVVAASKEMTEHLAKVLAPKAEPGDPTHALADAAFESSKQRFDSEHGGFGYPPHFAPKFPHASELGALLRHHARTGSEESLAMVELTLERMAKVGMYDQLGGGFHRYSVDREWLVPHFEKMLYDNSLLARVYLEAYQLTGKELYARIARETLDYMIREMQDAAGGFWSTTDADSEGEEGKFFVWQQREIEEVLGDDAPLAIAHWGVTPHGNWEHKNILTLAKTAAEIAAESKLSEDEVRERLAAARAKLYAHRGKRVPPGTDDKVLAAWNGMAIAAMAYGDQVLGNVEYRTAAQRAADFVLREMREDGRLLRSWRGGRARFAAYLDDYGFMADGLLCLFESDFDPRWLREARALLAVVTEHFRDAEDGNFFYTAGDHEELITRNKSVTESSIPSGIAMVAISYLRAGLQLGDEQLYAKGVGALRANHAILSRAPMAAPSLLLAAQFHLGDPREIVLVGDPEDATVQAFLGSVRSAFPPHRVVALLTADNAAALRELSPVYQGKDRVDGEPAAYVCRRGVCEAPVTDPAALQAMR